MHAGRSHESVHSLTVGVRSSKRASLADGVGLATMLREMVSRFTRLLVFTDSPS